MDYMVNLDKDNLINNSMSMKLLKMNILTIL